MFLAEKLSKSLEEVMMLSTFEIQLWVAYLELRKELSELK